MLAFAPHDLRCDENLLSEHMVTQATWHGEKWVIGVGGSSLLGDEPRGVVCKKPTSPLLWLTYAGGLENTSNSLQEVTTRSWEDAFGLRMTFAHALNHGRWGRGFFLNKHFQLRQQGEAAYAFLLLSPYGWAVYRKLNITASEKPMDAVTQFLWSSKSEQDYLCNSSPSQIIERLRSQINDSSSDFNFAQRFAALSNQERLELAWPCKRQDLATMERVLTWAFLSQSELWDLEVGLTWNVELDRDSASLIYSDEIEFLEIPPSLGEAQRKILDFFQPRQNEEAEQQHLCLRFFRTNALSIYAHNPTAHERLEASLEWRNWLETDFQHTD